MRTPQRPAHLFAGAIWLSTVLLVGIAAAGCGDGPNGDGAGSSDAGEVACADPGVDAGPPVKIACECLRSAYQAYVEEHRTCDWSWECVVVGGQPDGLCGCYASLGAPEGEAVNLEGARGARDYHQRYGSDGCSDFREGDTPTCEAGPSPGARCVDGRCTADPGACWSTTCQELRDRYQAHVAAHQGCERDEDCRIVGGQRYGLCDCAVSLGAAGGDAINVTGWDEAKALDDLYWSADCKPFRDHDMGTCDAGPSRNLRCEDGACRADPSYCNAR